MQKNLEPLFTPMKIGNVEIKNRIVLAPMLGTTVIDWMFFCRFNPDAGKLMINLAKNDVGLLIPGIIPIRSAFGNKWLYKHPEVFKPVKELTEELHKLGSKLFLQFTAGFGRAFSMSKSLSKLQTNKFLSVLAKPICDLDYLNASPSALPHRWMPEVEVRALEKKEIEDMIEAFAKTALLAKEAGVDGVEVHAVHEGYRLDQFTLPYTNKRTDEYGGSFENRYRFAVEIVKAIKKTCGEDYPVSLRYSVVSKTKDFCVGAVPGEEYIEVGRDMKESEKAAKYLEDAGYDALNCDNGTYDAWYWSHPPVYMMDNCNLDDVKHIKKFVNIPVICAGRMTPTVSAEAIKENEIDGVAFGRQLLTDNEYITKLENDKFEDIMPCICCHNACFPISTWNGVGAEYPMYDMMHSARCALNPRTLNNGKYDIHPAKKIKKVAVIGGGIGGMEAARIAAIRGHEVTLYEKSNELGGVFIAAATPSFKERDRWLIRWYKREMTKYPIDIKMNTEIKNLDELDADEVIIATGAKPRKLRMEGIDNAIEAIDFLRGKHPVGDKVVVIGGGLTGCEIAYQLALEGKHPVIVEMLDDLMEVVGLCAANSSMLKDLLNYHKVPIYLNSKVSKITDKNVTVVTPDGEMVLDCDSVVISVGYIPGSSLIEKSNKRVHIIGDANKVGNLRTAIWSANDIALKI
ncbi:MAG: FAD-dependent oxidoreductase [Bacillales bacterium]|nr:FAD-dependent oxidoreductase [Bacillales bacterium]